MTENSDVQKFTTAVSSDSAEANGDGKPAPDGGGGAKEGES